MAFGMDQLGQFAPNISLAGTVGFITWMLIMVIFVIFVFVAVFLFIIVIYQR